MRYLMRLSRGYRAGAVLPLTLFFLMIIFTMSVAFLSLTATSSRLAYRGYQKAQANALAEAGVNALYDQIAASSSNGTPNSTAIASTSLSGTIGTVTSADGSYSARVVNSPGSASPVTYVLEGTGVAPNGVTQSKVRAVFTATARGVTGFNFPEGAIVANGTVSFVGNACTVDAADAQGKHNAGAVSNGGVTSMTHNTSVDGPIEVSPSAYSTTVADIGSSPNDYGHTVTQLTSPVTFPSADTISGWATAWQQAAQEWTSTYPLGQNLSSYSSTSSSTLTAPCYISGDFSLSGQGTLTLQPDTTVPAPRVLYVHGNMSFTGGHGIVNQGVLIVCDGTISAAGGSGMSYSAANHTQDSGLISLSTSSSAISLAGNANETIGFVYAVNGGASLSGNAQITGSLISGGASDSVSFAGNGSLIYPDGLNGIAVFPASGYNCSQLGQWYQIL